jgi:predicted patatin/cPLA2 family phospholipase
MIDNSSLFVCIDSGGVRGYYSYRTIRYINDTIGTLSFGKCGGIVGVSAGAILASLYAFNLFQDISDDMCKMLIKTTVSLKWPNSLKSSKKYDILYDIFGDRTLGESQVPLYIVTTTTNGQPVVFDSTNDEYKTYRLVDVVNASSSIPVIMKPVKILDTSYIDGAISTGSPVALAYFIAKCKNVQDKDLKILSIGTDIYSTTLKQNVTNSRERTIRNVSLFSIQNISKYFNSSDILFNSFIKTILCENYKRISTSDIEYTLLDASNLQQLYDAALNIFLNEVHNIFSFLHPFTFCRLH